MSKAARALAASRLPFARARAHAHERERERDARERDACDRECARTREHAPGPWYHKPRR